MKRTQPRQRPPQRAANRTPPRPTPGYRRRGEKSAVERGWRTAFTGIMDLNLLPGRRGSDPVPQRAGRSGAAKRRARGRRPPVLRAP